MTFHVKIYPATREFPLFRLVVPNEYLTDERSVAKVTEYLRHNMCWTDERAGVEMTEEGVVASFPDGLTSRDAIFRTVDWLAKPYPTAR